MKLKIRIPANTEVYAKRGDRLNNILLFESELYQVLEEVKLLQNKSKYKFLVNNGQYVKKGDKLFSEGFINQRIMIAEANGVVEIGDDYFRILGNRTHYKRYVNCVGIVERIIPNKAIHLKLQTRKSIPVFYHNISKKISPLLDFTNENKGVRKSKNLQEDIALRNHTTLFFNTNLSLQDIARLYVLGYRRIICDSISVDNIHQFVREIKKLDGFCVLHGFGHLKFPKYHFYDGINRDVFWGNGGVYFSDKFEIVGNRITEHPFWGLKVDLSSMDDIYSGVSYDGEVFTVYNKNIKI